MTGARRIVLAALGLLAGGVLALLLGAGAPATASGAAAHHGAAGRRATAHAAMGHVAMGHAAMEHVAMGHVAMGHATMHHAATGDAATGDAATSPATMGRGASAPARVPEGNPLRGGAARLATTLRAAGTRSAPGRLLVTATEFRLALSRPSVTRGVVVVELHVAGEDPHDLALQRLDRRGRPTGRTYRIARVGPGALGDGEFRLTAGTWRLECTIPGHARMGMKATLRVR